MKEKLLPLGTIILCLVFSACADLQSNSSGRERASAEAVSSPSKTSFTIASWNVQTFFDAFTDGCEYSDFKSSAKWSEEKYEVRLKRLCQVLSSLDADIFALQEIENQGIIQDIANHFAGNAWNPEKNWTYACFSKTRGSAIGCAILSKYPLFGLKSHSLDIRSEKSDQPSMRPIMEVSADIKGREIIIIVNHWKSKSGGAGESQVWRKWQEKVLAQRLAELEKESEAACIILGDFNQDLLEFESDFSGQKSEGNIILNQSVRVFSPWFQADGSLSSEIGSYYYKNQWERIDHIFTFKNASIKDFAPRAEEPWADESKVPLSYKIYTGQGYSDHLPVMATVTVE